MELNEREKESERERTSDSCENGKRMEGKIEDFDWTSNILHAL